MSDKSIVNDVWSREIIIPENMLQQAAQLLKRTGPYHTISSRFIDSPKTTERWSQLHFQRMQEGIHNVLLGGDGGITKHL